MLAFFTYQTPPKFLIAFKEFYNAANIRHIKVLSLTIFIIAFLTRATSIFYYKNVIQIPGYHEFSLNNWIQITGTFTFFLLSSIALNSNNWSEKQKKVLTLCFILFILLVTFRISYIVSQHNTKNTLTMFLIGIVMVSLFFAVEYKEIIAIAAFIIIVFIWSMVISKITVQDKFMNAIAAFILGFILLCFSRYSYYFKSIHFVKIKQLEEKNLEIEHLNTQKSEILSLVAHDLRAPLNNIEALSGMMLAEKENREAKMIVNAAIQAKEIINDLIEAVKMDRTQMLVVKLELVSFFDRIIKKWQINSGRQITFTHSNFNLFVNGNASKLERAIDNLISNALKFSPEEKAILIDLKDDDELVFITVRDYGIGIPAHLQSYIFNQFTKASRKGLNGEKSIGLGLYISHGIIEQHNGVIKMESKENEGTTFTITLPKVKFPELVASQTNSAQSLPKTTLV